MQCPSRVAGRAAAPPDRRIAALDGLRGLTTILVILSHFFGEVPHGARALMVGWIAVAMFFVLSGFLIGRLILEKKHHPNFFAVFYVRRFCRIVPAYVVVVMAVGALLAVVPADWNDTPVRFPLAAYLTFTQTAWMVATGSIGAHWLAPTWTLAVEEHFYLVAPALLVFTPRRHLVPVLLAAVGAAVAVRAVLCWGLSGYGSGYGMAALVMLPAKMDALACGLLAAVALHAAPLHNEPRLWRRLTPALRAVPVVALVAAVAAKAVDATLFDVLGPLLIPVGCAAYLLCIVLGTPEAGRFHARALQWFGNNGYGLYLTHVPVLGLMHGLVLGGRPDVATPAQWAVTVAALPVCVAVGWGLTRLIEERTTAFGRTWQWGGGTAPARVRPPEPAFGAGGRAAPR